MPKELLHLLWMNPHFEHDGCNRVPQIVEAHITFTQQDLLDESLCKLGPFDTVTALHVLEHLPEDQLPLALQHLLEVTYHRLIIAVPYEAEATRAYGHEQVFTREKLERWGQWCVESIGGEARYWCEEVAGGLLVIDRF